MAKYLRTTRDVSLPEVIGRSSDDDYATQGVNYQAGSFVEYDKLPPHIQERVDSGQMEHLLEDVPEEHNEHVEQVLAMGGSEPDYGVFVPEHEAEAHALAQYGHVVVPKDQELEALSRGMDHHAEYQRAVKEAGYDRRPNVEATNPANYQRVPDEVLYGAETRTGLPHNRGPVNQEGEGDGEAEGDEGGEDIEAPKGTQPRLAARPAPGQLSESQSDQDAAAPSDGAAVGEGGGEGDTENQSDQAGEQTADQSNAENTGNEA